MKLIFCPANTRAQTLEFASLALNIIERVREHWKCFLQLRAKLHISLARIYRLREPHGFIWGRRAYHVKEAQSILDDIAPTEIKNELTALVVRERQ